MKQILLLSFILTHIHIFAQQKQDKKNIPGTYNQNAVLGKGKISGEVIDASTSQAVEFATVALIKTSDNKVVDGTSTDDKGKFKITNILSGEYKLLVSFIGYKADTIRNLTISDEKRNISLGLIKLEADANVLDDIVIEDEKDLIEDKIDRIVYNAEKDITNAGGTASDVLQKVPMVTVDLDGNVELRGSTNVRVLINNKPSSIMASNVADAIRQIPAETIKSVEVITNPSARYDGEGTAGIINIITKKNTLQGLSGSINASAGTRASSLNGNLNFRRKKYGLSLSTGGYAYYSPSEGFSDRENFDPESGVEQNFEAFNTGLFNNARLNFDYDISEKSYISSGVRFGSRYNIRTSDLGNEILNSNEVIINQFTRDIESDFRFNTVDWNIDYVKTFKNPKQELSILGLYSRDFGGNNYNLDQFDTSQDLNYKEKNENDSFNEEITFQTDYVHPIGERFKLETGVKGILRTVESDFQLFTFDFDNSTFVNIPSASNIFNYSQDVAAGYLSFDYTTKFKLGIQAGVRYEYTDIFGDFVSTDTEVRQEYQNFLPSILLAQDVGKGQKVKLAYNRRISRPSIFFLNPFVNAADSLNIRFGNPDLEPELTDNYELSYNLFFKRNSITASLYLRQTDNAISLVQTVDNQGVVSTTYDNVAKNQTVGFSAFGSSQITKNWRIGGNFNLYYVSFESPILGEENADFAYNISFNTSYKFPKGFSIQGFGFFNSPRVQLQGTQGAFSFYTLGLRKELFKGKGGLTFAMNNPFSRGVTIRSETEAQDFRSNSENLIVTRAFRIGFDMRFGKVGRQKRRKRKSIQNDDLKQGENNQQGG